MHHVCGVVDDKRFVARTPGQGIQTSASDFEKQWAETTGIASSAGPDFSPSFPEYKHPRKNWRLKQGATPHWYKARAGVRTKALSGAARVARFRPHKFN